MLTACRMQLNAYEDVETVEELKDSKDPKDIMPRTPRTPRIRRILPLPSMLRRSRYVRGAAEVKDDRANRDSNADPVVYQTESVKRGSRYDNTARMSRTVAPLYSHVLP